MPSIVQFFVKEALNAPTERPAFDEKRCLNARQSKLPCDACVSACPAGAIGKPGKVDWDRCVGCGLCAAACPAGAFALPEFRRRKAARLLADGHPVHVLGCQQAAGEMDSKAWCLSAFAWEQIAALALCGRVELVHGDCEACPRRAQFCLFERAMERVRAFLGDARFEAQVCLRAPGEAPRRGMSRRELLGAFLPKTKKAGADGGAERYGEDGQALRLMLADTLARQAKLAGQADDGQTYGWTAPAFGESCWACGICARICPNGAIRVREKDGRFEVICSPVLCTGCGTCAAVCPEHAIEGVRPIRLGAREKRFVHAANAAVCESCGAAMRPDEGQTLCLRCRAKKGKRR